MKNLFLTTILILVISPVIFADDNPPMDSVTVKEDFEPIKPKSEFNLSGYVDAYYSYNINRPENRSNFGTTGVGRIFDGHHGQIALGLAQLKVDYSKGKTTIVADLVFGPNADLANYGNTGTGLAIKQAYVSYEIVKKLTFTAGQFGTHIGYELVDAPDNFHYSLSNLFGNGPFYHTGGKLDYAVSDKVSVMAGVVNGWDKILDNNKAKSIIAQVGLTPNDDFYAYVNWIGGNETPDDVAAAEIDTTIDSYFKHMFDLTTGYTVSEKFSIGINAAYGFNIEGDVTTNWGGAALYLQYNINDHFGLGARYEYFDDTEGSQYLGTSYNGVTLTGSYTSPSGAFIVKPEIRFDKTSKDIYYKGKNNDLTNSQTTFGVAVIGKFNYNK